jgi:hypothetical protein
MSASAIKDMTDIDKLLKLKDLMGVVEDNTKRDCVGQMPNTNRERNSLKTVAALLLNRPPTAEDLTVLGI